MSDSISRKAAIEAVGQVLSFSLKYHMIEALSALPAVDEWLPIESAPKDGTVVDLWMKDEDGNQWREADAYYVFGYSATESRYTPDGKYTEKQINRDGWYAPNHDYDGEPGFCDMPRWFNEHPLQRKWVGCSPTHYRPLPAPPID